MTRIILSVLLMSLTLACNKVKRVEKKMSGDWNIIEYTFQNPNGLSYKYAASGTLTFNQCETEYCNYNLALLYVADGINLQKYESGTYTVLEDAEHFNLLRLDPMDIVTIIPCRVLHLNNSQMEIELKDEYGNHYLIFEKDN